MLEHTDMFESWASGSAADVWLRVSISAAPSVGSSGYSGGASLLAFEDIVNSFAIKSFYLKSWQGSIYKPACVPVSVCSNAKVHSGCEMAVIDQKMRRSLKTNRSYQNCSKNC